MTKDAMIRKIASEHNLSLALTDRILTEFIKSIQDTARTGKKFRVPRLGTFLVVKRGPTEVTAPNGQKYKVPKRSVVQFRPAKAFREAVQRK